MLDGLDKSNVDLIVQSINDITEAELGAIKRFAADYPEATGWVNSIVDRWNLGRNLYARLALVFWFKAAYAANHESKHKLCTHGEIIHQSSNSGKKLYFCQICGKELLWATEAWVEKD